MKVFVTRLALTSGIEEWDAKECNTPGVVSFDSKAGFTEYAHVEGRDWHKTKEAAIQKAEQMRVKKIANLKKQISKLEAITFK